MTHEHPPTDRTPPGAHRRIILARRAAGTGQRCPAPDDGDQRPDTQRHRVDPDDGRPAQGRRVALLGRRRQVRSHRSGRYHRATRDERAGHGPAHLGTAPSRSAGARAGPARGHTRPGRRRPGAVASRRELGGDDGAPSPTITLRALGIFLVSLVAFAVLAPTLRFSVAQQEQLRQLNSRVSEAAERNADLETQLALWQDPQYVQAQARDRLGFVMPGETPYVVVDPETVTGGLSEAEIEAEERKEARIAATPWYLHVWDSVQVAGESATGEEDPSGLTVPEPDAG
ncbi:FtsB family cell division protein [Georgenia yuyongxinii]